MENARIPNGRHVEPQFQMSTQISSPQPTNVAFPQVAKLVVKCYKLQSFVTKMNVKI